MKFAILKARRWSSVAAITLTVLAAMPAQAKKAPEPPYVYGPAPDWNRYKELGEKAVRGMLRDPDSAKFDWPNGYKQSGFTPFLSKRKLGYTTCGYVNARNSFGGYVGRTVFALVIDNDAVVYVELETPKGWMISGACDKSDFPRPDQMAQSATPTSGFGFTVSVAADGTRVAAVEPGGPAALAGLKPDMTIVQLNGVALTGMNETVVSQLLTATTGKGRFTLGDGRTIEIEKVITTPVANPS